MKPANAAAVQRKRTEAGAACRGWARPSPPPTTRDANSAPRHQPSPRHRASPRYQPPRHQYHNPRRARCRAVVRAIQHRRSRERRHRAEVRIRPSFPSLASVESPEFPAASGGRTDGSFCCSTESLREPSLPVHPEMVRHFGSGIRSAGFLLTRCRPSRSAARRARPR